MNPALIGLLQQLPPYNRPFPEKERWLAAFKAILDFDYPTISVCEICGTPMIRELTNYGSGWRWDCKCHDAPSESESPRIAPRSKGCAVCGLPISVHPAGAECLPSSEGESL